MATLAICISIAYAENSEPLYDIECDSYNNCGIYNPFLRTKTPEEWIFDSNGVEKVKKFETKKPLDLKTIPDVIFVTYPNLKTLNMEEAGIESLPDHHFAKSKGLTSLMLNSNKIRLIPSQAFEGCPDIIYIEVMNNVIEIIEDNAFRGLESLVLLDLSSNKIKQIGASAITGAIHLKYLNLNDNQIGVIENGALNFSGLEGVSLRRNVLTSLPVDLCRASPKLRYMHLSVNRLSAVGLEFDLCQKLKILYLDNNLIESVNFTSLANLENLNHLQLGYNQIKLPSTPPALVVDETKSVLETLPMEYNQMTDPDLFKHISGFRNIERISLRGNELTSFTDAKEIAELLPKLRTITLDTNTKMAEWVEQNKAVLSENHISIILN